MDNRKGKVLLSLTSLILLFMILMVPVRSEAAVLKVAIDVEYHQDIAREMLGELNEFRSDPASWYWNQDNVTKTICGGMGTLTYDYGLEKVAMKRAAEIAVSFSHTRPNGEKCFTAFEQVVSSVSQRGENLAAGYGCGYDDPSTVLTTWKEEQYGYSGQGHRRNMLQPEYKYVGIGCVEVDGVYFWTQEFCSVPSGDDIISDGKEKTAEIEINKNNIISIDIICGETDCRVRVGEKKKAPACRMELSVKEHWPSGTIVSSYGVPEFTASDGKYVSLKKGRLTGLKAGQGWISAEDGLGGEYRLEVTVEKENLTFNKNGLSYRVTDEKEKTVEVSGCYGKASDITIPASVSKKGCTYSVTGIAERAFKGNGILVSLTVGRNVKYIGKGAFYGCKKLKDITIKGKKLTEIGRNAFSGVSPKAEIHVPKSARKQYSSILAKIKIKIVN